MRVLAVVHQDDAGPGVFADSVRERGAALEEWRPAAGPPPRVDHDAVIVLGGAMNVHEEAAHPWLRGEKEVLRELVARKVPLLGVCLGAQLLADIAGGSVRRADPPEIGWFEVVLACEPDPLLAGLPERFTAFGWHSYEAVPPPGGVALARSDTSLQAYRLDAAPAWGIQFHAEVDRRTAEVPIFALAAAGIALAAASGAISGPIALGAHGGPQALHVAIAPPFGRQASLTAVGRRIRFRCNRDPAERGTNRGISEGRRSKWHTDCRGPTGPL